jgi:hypothetical protein
MSRARARDPRREAAWLADELSRQAGEHEPDLTRIEAKFDRLIAGEPRRTARRDPARPARLRLRLIGVPLGALAAVTTATLAVGVTLGISHQPSHPVTQAAASPSPSEAGTELPSASPATVHPAGSASARGVTSATASAGPLTAVASLDSHTSPYWAQENLNVTTTRVIKALHVTVTVSGGAAVQSTGYWSTILPVNLDGTVNHTNSGLTYDITVKPGQVLQPGTYAFGFQFNRGAIGHDFTLDTFTVTATTVQSAQQLSTGGTFG